MTDLFNKCVKFTTAREAMAAGFYPYFHKIQGGEGPEVLIDGKKKIVCCSNNYLGLTMDSRVKNSAIEAIKKADGIILGPGSLYTSIIPNLLVEKISKEIIASKALKMYVCNVMTQKGETEGYKASDHLEAIVKHTAPGIVDYCIVNTAKIPDSMAERYRGEGASPVMVDTDNIKKMKCKVIEAHIITIKDYVRHDAVKLAKIAVDLIGSLKKAKA